MTNADRIRNMEDEELTEFIFGLNEHCLAGIGLCDCSREVKRVRMYAKIKHYNGLKARQSDV